ncbi:MAG: methyltransferase [Verrucomicrobiota bacterium]
MAKELPLWWFLKTGITATLVGMFVVVSWHHQLKAPDALIVLAQAIIAIGALINLYHYRILKRVAPRLGAPQKLATHGGLLPWIRHPMYLGELIFVLGLTLLISSLWALVLAVIYFYAIVRLSVAEDRQMATRFGDVHAHWCRKTSALLPQIW